MRTGGKGASPGNLSWLVPIVKVVGEQAEYHFRPMGAGNMGFNNEGNSEHELVILEQGKKNSKREQRAAKIVK